MTSKPPLILHVIFRLAVGGLENGLVNLINHPLSGKYRHAILCLDEATKFGMRLKREVEIIELKKRPGKDFASYVRLARIIRKLQPRLAHTRNYGTLDTQFISTLNGVPYRIHGEHGSDSFHVDCKQWKRRTIARVARYLVHAYVAVSADLFAWLTSVIHVPCDRVHYIPNGVDIDRFSAGGPPNLKSGALGLGTKFLVGTVGRMEGIKNQLCLVDAFIALLERRPDLRTTVGLVLIGDGPLRKVCVDRLAAALLADVVFAPGSRDDIPDVLRALDVFVLPSLVEGLSNAVLEAMASGLPVIATNVGGNEELVRHGITGTIVPFWDASALSRAIEYYCDNPGVARQHGEAGKAAVAQSFSLDSMVKSYVKLYDSVFSRAI